MTTKRWPDGSPRSTGNGFDLDARRAKGPSIFFTAAEQGKATAHRNNLEREEKARAQKADPKQGNGHATMPNLSDRATRQLMKAPVSMPIGRKSDAVKRTKARKAAI